MIKAHMVFHCKLAQSKLNNGIAMVMFFAPLLAAK